MTTTFLSGSRFFLILIALKITRSGPGVRNRNCRDKIILAHVEPRTRDYRCFIKNNCVYTRYRGRRLAGEMGRRYTFFWTVIRRRDPVTRARRSAVPNAQNRRPDYADTAAAQTPCLHRISISEREKNVTHATRRFLRPPARTARAFAHN